MRLLDTVTLEIQDFITPPQNYAILSHTWGQEEVSLSDWRNSDVSTRKGYQKINAFCVQAAKDGYRYGWVDTCCIDKSSSAELSEAINSMFKWYEGASLCYVYLSDVGLINEENASSALSGSRWFTRGWTLQELVAPARVAFFNRDWAFMGTKLGFAKELARITNIGQEILVNKQPLDSATVAQRMGWAASRVTTRTEDMAYCLLGIFGVSMPLLYGEGDKAFFRLQVAILASTDDQSILTWNDRRAAIENFGPLAQSPDAFKFCSDIVPYFRDPTEEIMPWSMTNRGLHIQLPIVEPDFKHPLYELGTVLGLLNCSVAHEFSGPLALRLRQFAKGMFSRVPHSGNLNSNILVPYELAKRAVSRTIYIREETLLQSQKDRRHGFYIRKAPTKHGYSIYNVYPEQHWNKSQMTIYRPCNIAALDFRGFSVGTYGKGFVVVIRPTECRVFRDVDIPFTRQPVFEARRLLQTFKDEMHMNVLQKNFTSLTAVSYDERCNQTPGLGEPRAVVVPDYESIFLSMKPETDRVEGCWASGNINARQQVIVKIQPEEVMGVMMLVVDIEIQDIGRH